MSVADMRRLKVNKVNRVNKVVKVAMVIRVYKVLIEHSTLNIQ